jgi:hypothetical protein
MFEMSKKKLLNIIKKDFREDEISFKRVKAPA